MSWNTTLPDAEYYEEGDPRLPALVREIEDHSVVAIDSETTGLSVHKDIVLFWSMAWGANKRICLHWNVLHHFAHIFADPTRRWIFANAKYDMHMFANVGYEFAGECVDVAVMHCMIFEEDSHALKDMAHQILGWRWTDFFDTFKPIIVDDEDPHLDADGKPLPLPKGKKKWTRKQRVGEMLLDAYRVNRQALIDYASNDAYGTLRLYEELKKELEQTQTWSLFPEDYPTMAALYFRTEMPFTKVLWKCERAGIYVSTEKMDALRGPMDEEVIALKRDMFALAREAGLDGSFNPNSTDQMRKWFIDYEQRKPLMMTKGGKSGIKVPSIDKGFLEHYEHDSEMARLILRERQLSKLIGTYIEGAARFQDTAGRIHPRFNQADVRSGRLSCVAEHTELETPGGLVPVKNLRVGDYVLTHKERWRRVLDVFTKGFEEMYDLHLSNGQVLTCTPAHKLLTTEGEWLPAKEFIDECLESLGRCTDEPSNGSSDVPFVGDSDRREDCGSTGHHAAQRAARAQHGHAEGGTARIGQGAVLRVEERREQPDAREDGRSAPELQGGLRGRTRLPDVPLRGEEAVRASHRDDGTARAEGTSSTSRGAPHRFGPEEQQPGQPRVDHEAGASAHSLFAGEGREAVRVAKVVHRGRLEVHDLTVEEDASYRACGVFSHNSADPNAQNVPNAEKDEFKLRSAFMAEPGKGTVLIVGDYEQLEMRLLACATQTPEHPKGAEAMVQIFLDGKDIHMGNAEMVYGPIYKQRYGWDLTYAFLKEAKKIDGKVKDGELPESARTEEVHLALLARNYIKSVGFGLNYGMKEQKLSRQLGIPVEQALGIINAYLGRYPAVSQFYASAIALTKDTGYSYTLLGRRRFHPFINAKNNMDRWSDERKCVNTPIQGTAADVVRMAMLKIDAADLETKYGCRMLLQVHDELMFECPAETAEAARDEIRELMEHPFKHDLLVPLTVSIGIGPTWISAK